MNTFTKNEPRLKRFKSVKHLIAFFWFTFLVEVAKAQTSVDFNQSGLSGFKTKVLPILNGIVAVFAVFGIFYAVYKFFTGDAQGGKQTLVTTIVGGIIWGAAAAIITALA